MSKYAVYVKEIWKRKHVVEAASKEEAVSIVNELDTESENYYYRELSHVLPSGQREVYEYEPYFPKAQ